MTIIFKYLIKEAAKYYAIIMTIIIAIYIAVDFVEKIGNFVHAGFPALKIAVFFLYRIPFIAGQTTPVALLLSVLVVFGLMSKNNEILALKSSGISIYYLLRPVLAVGVVSAILLFFFAETVVPITAGVSNRIWENRESSVVATNEKDIWIKDNRDITHINYYTPEGNIVFGVTRNYLDNNFNLVKRIDAKKGVYKDGQWVLYDVMEQDMDAATENFNVTFHGALQVAFNFKPDDLMKVIKQSEEMGFMELSAYIHKIESEGYDASHYKVDLYAKTAFPFVCIIMSMVGAGIAARGTMVKGLPLSISYGLAITACYWIFFSFCLSLGYGEVLSPFIAAWIPNLIFICAGVMIIIHAE